MSDPHATPVATTSTTDHLGETDSPAMIVGVFLAVVLLSAANIGLSIVGFGKYTLVVQLAIGTMQAGLVSFYWMHLRQGDKVVILTGLASIFWMGILFVLFMSDYMTRIMVIG